MLVSAVGGDGGKEIGFLEVGFAKLGGAKRKRKKSNMKRCRLWKRIRMENLW